MNPLHDVKLSNDNHINETPSRISKDDMKSVKTAAMRAQVLQVRYLYIS